MTAARSDSPGSRHLWLVGPAQADRAAILEAGSFAEPWLPPVAAHRRLRGPYTAAGSMLRQTVPRAMAEFPSLVTSHEVEILTAAPELKSVVAPTIETLTSLAVPEERTRFYSGLRTLRLAHGLTEFFRDYLIASNAPPRSLFVDDLHAADFTDQELIAVMLRRIDPRLLTLLIGSAEDLDADPVEAAPGNVARNRADASGLRKALAEFSDRLGPVTPATGTAPDESAELDILSRARAFIWGDCVDDRPTLLDAYRALDAQTRAQLHDQRAEELTACGEESLEVGAIPHHRRLGTDPRGSGSRCLLAALNRCMLLGFYDATIEFCYQGRALFDKRADKTWWWRFTTKLPTSLSAIDLHSTAEAICAEARAAIDTPEVHLQLAYSQAMLLTRHLEPERRDHELAMGWINQAIAISSILPDLKKRAFHTVFHNNGRALIEAHLANPEAALQLVTAGIDTLDRELEPAEHRLHRSVLRYNRAQVLVMLGRLEDAVADYRSVIAQDPNYPEYHFDLANLLHRLGEDEEALAEYQTTAKLGPPFPELFYNRADLLAGMGRWDEALADFGYVLELAPDYLDAYLNRAGILADLGDADAAERDIAAGLSLDPRNPYLLALRGRLQLDAGNLSAARSALEASRQADPALAETWALLASLAMASGQPEEALSRLTTAIELSPDPITLFNRGSVLQELRRWHEAVDSFSQALAMDPQDPDTWLQRARCRIRLGDIDGARADRNAFLGLAPDRAHEAAALLELQDATV